MVLTTQQKQPTMPREGTTSIKYPDNEIVAYTYDISGNLSQVTGYATYTNYNALGQAQSVIYGNGVTTTYQYYSTNNRLFPKYQCPNTRAYQSNLFL